MAQVEDKGEAKDGKENTYRKVEGQGPTGHLPGRHSVGPSPICHGFSRGSAPKSCHGCSKPRPWGCGVELPQSHGQATE